MEEKTLLEEVQQHLDDSDSYLESRREEWDDLESILIAQLNDDISQSSTKSKVYDPKLSTIAFERAARVMAQNPSGKAYAQSKDDVGKNMLMNLLLKHYENHANESGSMLIKFRLMDLYSMVYGTMFGLVPWRVNETNGYIGPEFIPLPIRDCYPQPHIRNVDDMDWFIVRNVTSLEWLKQQDTSTWKNIDRLEADLAKSGGDGKDLNDSDKKSFVERTYYPGQFGDEAFPLVEMYTEYRRDKWITWTPNNIDDETSKPYILREIEDPYVEGMLPIVAKHAFPLIDSPIGLGEFTRGKTLQYAINSLWNLYLDGVKYSIFPPIHINSDNVVPSSIKWGAGEYWFMDNPNQDVQPMQMNPQGMDTFHNTFGALTSALQNQAGTTSISEQADSQSSLGKTPQAVKFIARRESARDEWDRIMMEDTIDKVYQRWIALTVQNMEKEVQMRLFAEEIEDIKAVHPDVVEMFESGKRGTVKITKENIEDTYDFVLETGSTFKPNIEQEQQNLTSVLKAVLENPGIMEALQQKGKSIDIAELFKRWVIAGGIKDYDKIIIENQPMQEGAVPGDQEQMMGQQGQQIPPEVAQQVQQGMGQQAPPDVNQIKDPMLRNAAMELLGGTGGIPPRG